MAGATAEHYRRQAEQAERQASAAKTDHEKSAWRRIAQGWRDLETNEIRKAKEQR